MKNRIALGIVIWMLCSACAGGVREESSMPPDGGQDSAVELDSGSRPDLLTPGIQEEAASVETVGMVPCNRTPIANVYGCETSDRLTAPLAGVSASRVTVYLDSNPIPPSLWRLTDDGNTLVLQHCVDTGVMVSFSLDCRSTAEDCHLTARGCP